MLGQKVGIIVSPPTFCVIRLPRMNDRKGCIQGMLEGLKEQLSPHCTSQQHEITPVAPLPPPQPLPETAPQPGASLKGCCAAQQALPEHLRERMSTIIQGSAEVSIEL